MKKTIAMFLIRLAYRIYPNAKKGIRYRKDMVAMSCVDHFTKGDAVRIGNEVATIKKVNNSGVEL